jgi:hypothetical protein
MDFNKRANRQSQLFPYGSIGRNRSYDNDDAIAAKQLSNVTDAPDIFISIFSTESEAFGEARPHLISV